jgi:Zn finger protein HypA/HybF involved in hydrogenase expression
MVRIATFEDSAKARHLKERFVASGLHADVHTEGRPQQVVSRATAQANVQVLVEESDFNRAQELMTEWEKSDPEVGSAIRCPQCKSPRIHYPQLPRKFPIIPGFAAVLLALKIVPKEFYCEDCQFTWTNEDTQPRYRFWRKVFGGPAPQP